MFFFHINKEVPPYQVTILQGTDCIIVRRAEFFEVFDPFADCHGDFGSHDFVKFCLDLAADFLDSSIEITAPFLLEENAHAVVAFLINDSGVFAGYDLIADIKEDKCHECTLLAFLHIDLIHAGIEVDIKNCHAVSTAGKCDSHFFKFSQAFLDIYGTVYKSFQCLGANDLCICAVVLGRSCK